MNNPIRHNRIGIDIGGVIIAQDTDEPDLFFTNSFLKAKPFPNSFETIQQIIEAFGKENVFIISKCGTNIQKKSREWLEYQNFFSITGFEKDNIHFCLERHEKAGIAEMLNLNFFIDDRYTVLSHMLNLPKIEKLILFCPNHSEHNLLNLHPHDKIIEVDGWFKINTILNLS